MNVKDFTGMTSDTRVDFSEYTDFLKKNMGMISLIPSDADAAKLARDWGLPPEELHTTIFLLGRIPEKNHEELFKRVLFAVNSSLKQEPLQKIQANAYSVNLTNPHTESRFTSINLTIDFHSKKVVGFRDNLLEKLNSALFYEQNFKFTTLWSPHLNLGYIEYDFTQYIQDSINALGYVSFDKIRVAIGEFIEDIPIS